MDERPPTGQRHIAFRSDPIGAIAPGGGTLRDSHGLLGGRDPSPPPVTRLTRQGPGQRTKLWQLNDSFHCSIVGTCLTTAELRKVMAKVLKQDVSILSDHDLHSRAVALCSQHNACARAVQKALDQRHHGVVNRFAKLRDEEAVLTAWADARCMGDIPGAYWAVLTHPDVTPVGMRRAFGDVHMLSHLVGAANRADIRRLAALEEKNARLAAKADRQQQRLHEAITSREATIRRLSALAARQVPTEAAGDDALAGLRELVATLQSRLDAEIGRRERLERRVAEAADASEAWQKRAVAAERECAELRRAMTCLAPGPGAAPRSLPALRVLYVGGRPGCVEQARGLLAAAGGELLCHDGGQHDHPSLLPCLIGRVDHVVFPVDCVSHDAALTVKRTCRQLGKPWSPLRSSGVASFLAALSAPEGADAAGAAERTS